MGRNDRWVYLVPAVDEFRQSLSPDEQEEFNELLIHAYLDPHGERTGAVLRATRLPLVHYAYSYGQFGILYRVYKLPQDAHDRIEVFYASYADEADADD